MSLFLPSNVAAMQNLCLFIKLDEERNYTWKVTDLPKSTTHSKDIGLSRTLDCQIHVDLKSGLLQSTFKMVIQKWGDDLMLNTSYSNKLTRFLRIQKINLRGGLASCDNPLRCCRTSNAGLLIIKLVLPVIWHWDKKQALVVQSIIKDCVRWTSHRPWFS